MRAFYVTFDTVTPESAEHGDSADRGFVTADDIEVSTVDSPVGPAFEPIKAAYALTLREAVKLVGCMENSGWWFTEVDGRDDYRTGANTVRAFHFPDNVTRSSYNRLARLLNVR